MLRIKKIIILKKIKSFSVIILQEELTSETKAHKFTLGKVVALIAAYSFFIAIAGYIFLEITGIGSYIVSESNIMSKKEIKQVEMLNKRVIFMTRELESLKSTNEQLKYALTLGDSTLFDSLSNKKDSAKSINKGAAANDLLAVVRELISGIKSDDQSSNSISIVFTKPVINGFISRGFDPKIGHFGIDYVVKRGTPIYASASGYVIFSGFTITDGNMLIIQHPDGYITVYKHCSILLKSQRDEVFGGELIALSGNSGETSTGPHLHFEIWKDGKPVNPKKLLINLF